MKRKSMIKKEVKSCYATTLKGEKCKNPIGEGSKTFKGDGGRIVVFCALHVKECFNGDYKAFCPESLWYKNIKEFRESIRTLDVFELIELREQYEKCRAARKKKVDLCFQGLTDSSHIFAITKMVNAIGEINKLLKF